MERQQGHALVFRPEAGGGRAAQRAPPAGAPLTVRRDGDRRGQTLTEGHDFEHVADPNLGVIPWPGEYDVWHEPPPIRTKLPGGTRLRVSYYHPLVIYGGSVMIALSEPRTMELLRDQARRVHAAFGAKAYFMEYDEIRLFNWDAAAERRHLDAGQALAASVKASTQILRSLEPAAKIYVWSDMFDPHHNAVKNYYLVHGSLVGSWKGLDPSVEIANWNFGHRDKSLKFFAARGHHSAHRRLLRQSAGEHHRMARLRRRNRRTSTP